MFDLSGPLNRLNAILSLLHCYRTFYETPPSKNPSKNLVLTANPYRRLLGTLLRSTYFQRAF